MKKLLLLFVLFVGVGVLSLSAQTRVITGTVTPADESAGEMIGVSVYVKGTTIGTITDINGDYSLPNVPNDATILVFSFIGMKTQEVEIGGRSVVNCVLESEAIGLEEVVVSAFGIQREKREITYQTQKIGSDDLAVAQPTRATSALAGKVAGLQINVQDHGVNPNTQIVLRGFRSITSGNQALVVIDGAISSIAAFDDLNPNDIADVNVLKGATAAALYGSKAGNGAIIVSTKRGEAGQKFTIGVNSSYTSEKVAYMPKFQSEYGVGWEGQYIPYENCNWGPRFDGLIRQIGPTFEDGTYQEVPYAPVANNLRDFYDVGHNLSNTVYMSGSGQGSSFYLSIGQQGNKGIVPKDVYSRNTFRVNATKKIGDVELAVNSSFFTDKTDVVGDELGTQNRPLYWFILNTPNNIPLSNYRDWENDLYSSPNGYYNAYYENPYVMIDQARNQDRTSRLNANISLSWDISDWLNFTGRASVNNVWGDGENWREAFKYDPVLKSSMSDITSFLDTEEFQQSAYTTDFMLTGNFNYGDFTLKSILGTSTYSFDLRQTLISVNNLSIPDFWDLSNGTGTPTIIPDARTERNLGVFGDFTFGYNNYLFLTFTGRNDWTSTLAKGQNSYFYPAVGLSFVVTDAVPTLKSGDILSYAKVTASNSTVYNDLSAYMINETFQQHTAFPLKTNGFVLAPTTIDSEIRKEKLNTTEVGLNLGFFRSKVHLDAAYFLTRTTDLITRTTPSMASGATSFLTNIGELQGSGVEVTLGGTIVDAAGFVWDQSFNYSTNSTIVKSIKDDLKEIAVNTYTSVGIYAVVDEEFPQLKSNTYQRTASGQIIVDATSGEPLTNLGLQSVGRTLPKHIFGGTTNLSYKGINLSGTFDYRTGHVFYSQLAWTMEFTGRSLASVSSNRQDFVVPNSVYEDPVTGAYVENTNIPVSGGNQSYWTDVYNNVYENYVYDASALKLREVAISYDLPASILKKTPLSKVSIGFTGRNLLTFLPAENCYSDPEFQGTESALSNNAVGMGGYYQSPPTKTYGVTLNVEF
ncbi:MAG: SusC/RagA family TonB-linked outer membrane protein [Bacteroidales bacterium]|jgi:TonB-linked SusC/RagA family outer membrane protein